MKQLKTRELQAPNHAAVELGGTLDKAIDTDFYIRRGRRLRSLKIWEIMHNTPRNGSSEYCDAVTSGM